MAAVHHRAAAMGRRARRALVAAAVLGIAAFALPASGVAQSVPGVADVPPLPPQPGTPAAACTPPPGAPGAWTQVYQSKWSGSTGDQLQFDPWNPCRIFRATDGQHIHRSTDSGRTWQPVFADTAISPTVTTHPNTVGGFQATSLTFPAPGQVVMSENGVGDAVINSPDAGAHWSLADNGIVGEPVYQVAAVPGHPRVEYAAAVVDQGGAATSPYCVPATTYCQRTSVPTAALFVTSDGGGTWARTTLPPLVANRAATNYAPAMQIQVDPGAASDPSLVSHLWVFLPHLSGYAGDILPAFLSPQQRQYYEQSVLLETTDAGRSWTAATVPDAWQLLVTRTYRHGLRLWLVQDSLGLGQLEVSSQDGAKGSWNQVDSVPQMMNPFLAADPVDGERMMVIGLQSDFAGRRWTAVSTADGFEHGLLVPGPSVPQQPVGGTGFANLPMAGTDHRPDAYLQADILGNFYFLLSYSCNNPQCAGATLTQPTYFEQYWRFTPPLPQSPRFNAGTLPVPDVTKSLPGAPTPFVIQRTPLFRDRVCPVPSLKGDGSGSLALLGGDLLYTDTGESGPHPYQGVIHKYNGGACVTDGDIVVDFDPAEIRRANAANGNPVKYDSAPVIDTLAVDTNHHAIYVSLWTKPSWQQGTDQPDVGIFYVRITDSGDGVRRPAHGVATFRYTLQHCLNPGGGMELLTYDPTDDTLWTCAQLNPGHIHAADATVIPTCMAGLNQEYRGNSATSELATWAWVSPGHLYLQTEGDDSADDIDTSTCRRVAAYAHAIYQEPSNEDEQMVCDPVSVDRATVLWLRDGGEGTVSAYTLPDGYCPVPTRLRYDGDTHVVRGQTALLCATLLRVGDEVPVYERSVSFQLNGDLLGNAVSDGNGRACLLTVVALGAGQYPITASFNGDRSYTASSDKATLTVSEVAAHFAVPPPPALLPALGPAALPPHAPVNGPNPQITTNQAPQAQGQMQVQPQGQAQAQSIAQPGVIGQQQEQVQVQVAAQAAMLAQEDGQQSIGYSMNATSHPHLGRFTAAMGTGGLLAFFGLGIAWVMRSPGVVSAAARRRRRPE